MTLAKQHTVHLGYIEEGGREGGRDKIEDRESRILRINDLFG